jgi:hypothetical protein
MIKKVCCECEQEVVRGYWYRYGARVDASEPAFWCDECVPDLAKRFGVRDEGSPNTEYMVIDVILMTDVDNTLMSSVLSVLSGDSDDELLDAAKGLVAEMWPCYRVVDSGSGGCCEIIDEDYMTCRHACISVTA